MKYLRALAPLLFVTPIALVAGPLVAPAQQMPPAVGQPRDTRPAEPVGTASISGIVTAADSGQPARKARVTLSGPEVRGRSVTTDESGRFAFSALPAGRYTVSASKAGHVSVTYGQRRPGRPGTAIQLADGQKMQVQLQIPRGGVITGTVLDEHGEAVPGTPVRVLRYVIQSGVRTLQMSGNGATDDRGVYRIYGLQPGEYVVAALPRNPSAPAQALRAELTALQARIEAVARDDAAAAREMAARAAEIQMRDALQDEATSGYAPVYYPGTTVPSSAASVIVGASEEKMGIDFGLQLVPIARVEGVVVTSTGQAAQNIQVTLVNVGQDVPGLGTSSARPDRDGRFTISNVAPGQYMLVARATMGGAARGATRLDTAAPLEAVRAQVEARRGGGPDAVRLWAMQDVSVDGRNLSNLVLTLQPGMNISGRLVFEGTSPPPADLTRLRVSASAVAAPGPGRQLASTVAGRVDTNGRFTITGVVPGRYRITASGSSQEWRLASSIVSGQDTLDFPMEMKPNTNVGEAVLTFTDRQTEISGTITDAQGQPASDYTIIVYPAEREFWTPQTRRIQTQRPDTSGRFTFRALPPGEYRIAPLLDPEPGTWYDPAFLQQLDSAALRVPLGPGEAKVQNLRISGQEP